MRPRNGKYGRTGLALEPASMKGTNVIEKYVVDGILLSITGNVVTVVWVPSHISGYKRGQIVNYDPVLVRAYGKPFGLTRK